ncbi:MAG: hypothetical protein ACLP8S_12205 [Solirubrobacteraceae bacterium]
MFFGSRKRTNRGGGLRPSDHAGDPAGTRQSREWDAWRRSAQKATRAWNEWLAADHRAGAALWRCYIASADEEERTAMELERSVNRGVVVRQGDQESSLG